ncbi:MAG: hypothetical protein RSC98_07690 [Clostridia bacterium]
MASKIGRPLKGETKRDHRVAVKLNDAELQLLNECSERMQVTKTSVVVAGIRLVKQALDKEK